MTIRLIAPADLQACGRIYAEAFAVSPYNGNWTEDSASSMLSGLFSRDPEHCWLMEEGLDILGFAFCTTFGRFRGTIQEFAIAPRFQKRGLGTRLMEHVLKEFMSEGLLNADLIANLDASAHSFYKKFGFRTPSKYVVMARSL